MHEAEPTVFVVDDDPSVRESLATLLGSVDRNSETFGSAARFLEVYDGDRPGCLVLDIRMPGMSGLDLQDRLESLGSTLPIIFLTAHGDVPRTVRAMKAGAADFVQKPFRDQELLDRIQEALTLDRDREADSADYQAIKSKVEQLTQRELEVFQRVTQGQANKVIAIELGISERTVEIHRSHVMQKMEARTLADLVRMKIRLEQEGAS